MNTPHGMAVPLSGQRLGPYEIGTLIGAGGMGAVYRGRDPILQRDVAIKVLPDIFAADASRRARFEREARVLASLNHPHIATIYGFEHREGIHALVLEFVEGQTLADRLRSGPLPVRDALTVGRQVAEALQAAHDRGIVHRDLKPANIIAQEGEGTNTPHEIRIKVLDFGIAKTMADDSAEGLLNSPTVTAGGTAEGVVLGTATYMSPEQARGKPVDKRTDIWAFGCVLWELLCGRHAFTGETVSDTIAAILDREPDWAVLPSNTPAGITRLLQRCLEKDPKRRLHDIADARIEIDDALAAPALDRGAARSRRGAKLPRSPVVALTAGLAVVAATVAAIVMSSRPTSLGPLVRVSVFTPGLLSPQLSATLSPDGRELAFVSTGESGKLMLGIRSLESGDARILPGTENAAHPSWSPDGRFLAFLAEGKLKKVAAAGGTVDTLADAPERFGGTWSRDDMILFPGRIGELTLIPAAGGPLTTIVPRDPQGVRSSWPHFLPDGRHFLYNSRAASGGQRGIYVRALDSTSGKFLVASEYKGAYASGHLLFVRGETLMAQPFDVNRLELSGQPFRVADGVWGAAGAAQASFSASQTGTVAYVNASLKDLQLVWFDRAGRSQSPVGGAARYNGPFNLSPDGRRIAAAVGGPTQEKIWFVDADGTSSARVTFGDDQHVYPVWSANGERFAYLSGVPAPGSSRIFVRNASGAGTDELLIEQPRIFTLDDWSPDGRFLVYTAPGPRSGSDLWLLPIEGDRKPRVFLQTAFNKVQSQISPDGRWIAYTSYESGSDEVYVESFPVAGDKHQVSVAGGVQPRWRSDGNELFYVAPDGRLMAVPVRPGSKFDAGAAVPLFKSRLLPQGSQSIGLATLYDVSRDGLRFLAYAPPVDRAAPITVVLNWLGTPRQ